MGWRRKVEEFEAGLFKHPMPRFLRFEKGELERKEYDDGEERLEISFHGVPASDGALARVVVDGSPVCEVQVNGGRGRTVLTSREGDTVPKVARGSVAEIQYQGQTVLRGVFKPD